MIIVDRLPIRGRGWLISIPPIGGVAVVIRPRFFIQFLGMDSRLRTPDWLRALIDE